MGKTAVAASPPAQTSLLVLASQHTSHTAPQGAHSCSARSFGFETWLAGRSLPGGGRAGEKPPLEIRNQPHFFMDQTQDAILRRNRQRHGLNRQPGRGRIRCWEMGAAKGKVRENKRSPRR